MRTVKSLAERIGVSTPLELRIVPDLGASIHRQGGEGARSTSWIWAGPWSPRSPRGAGVLAHELAHERDLRGSHRHVHAARARLADSRRIPLIGSALLRETDPGRPP